MMSPRFYSNYDLTTPGVNIQDIKTDCEKSHANDFIYFKSPIDFENVIDKSNHQSSFISYLSKDNIKDIKEMIENSVTERVVDGLKKK